MALFSSTAQAGTSHHLAEQCKDDGCMRLPCRMFRAGYRKGYDDGYNQGFAEGEACGFAAGYAAGMASATSSG